jgi:hypothetical protein
MSKLEKQAAVDQQTHPAAILLAARPEFVAQCGTVDASWRRRGDKTFGPYDRLRYRLRRTRTVNDSKGTLPSRPRNRRRDSHRLTLQTVGE